MKKALFLGLFIALTTMVSAQKVEFRDGGAIATLNSKPDEVVIKSKDRQVYNVIRFDNIIFICSKEQFAEISGKLETGGKVQIDSWFVEKTLLFAPQQLKKASLRLGIPIERLKMFKIIRYDGEQSGNNAWGS